MHDLENLSKRAGFYGSRVALSRINEIKKEAKKNLKKTQMEILSLVNQQYNSNINYNNLPPKDLLDLGTIKVLHKLNYINKIIKDRMIESLPLHPKDEYAETRKMKRHFIIHSGVTNTGKTYEAVEDMKRASKGVYLSPLRLLALEIYQKLNDCGILCSLITGEEEHLLPNSNHCASTIEIADISQKYDVAVIDEAQMISDPQRGASWTKAIFGLMAKRIHICCSPDAVDIIIKLIKDCNDSYEVMTHIRNTPLKMDYRKFKFPDSIEKGDALIVFSKKMVLKVAAALAEKNIKASVVYGNLPPHTRKKQIEAFLNNDTDVVVATDAIGMGLNLPIKRVVFLETYKFDGTQRRPLKDIEIKQIAGRAGRRNMYDIGYVNSYLEDKNNISLLLEKEFKKMDSVYIKPLDSFILKFPIGTLRERLVSWSQLNRNIDYFKNFDITTQLYLLSILDNFFENRLSVMEQYKLIFIPFDHKNDSMLVLWKSYIQSYLNIKSIERPKLRGENINEYELYYKKLDLYYSFCKTLDISFDNEWLVAEKAKISDQIHELLMSEMKNMGQRCVCCGKTLPWNHFYNMCDNCYFENNLYG